MKYQVWEALQSLTLFIQSSTVEIYDFEPDNQRRYQVINYISCVPDTNINGDRDGYATVNIQCISCER